MAEHYFIAGSTGATGVHLVSQLLEGNNQVTAAIRDKKKAPWPTNPNLTLFETDWSTLPPLEGIDVVITAMGTSRVNPEVAADMEKMGADEGFVHWLKKIDLGLNLSLAHHAYKEGVQHFARISASSANSSNRGSGFNVYSRYQGESDDLIQKLPFPKGVSLMRPGRLERGEEFRTKRGHEQKLFEEHGPGLEVEKVARCTIRVIKEMLHAGKTQVRITPDDQIREMTGHTEL